MSNITCKSLKGSRSQTSFGSQSSSLAPELATMRYLSVAGVQVEVVARLDFGRTGCEERRRGSDGGEADEGRWCDEEEMNQREEQKLLFQEQK